LGEESRLRDQQDRHSRERPRDYTGGEFRSRKCPPPLRRNPGDLSHQCPFGAAGETGRSSLWEKADLPFERYIHDTLDEDSRIRLKFLNPLGIGSHLVDKYLKKVDSRTAFLKTDFDLLTDVETQLAVYREDMHHNFSFRMGDIENILSEMENVNLF
jgi:hypothetical protein